MTHPHLTAIAPLFVDRAAELAEFDALLDDLGRGVRRHLALLGLRRIGKTVLLDEVRRRRPAAAIACLALEEVVSTPEDFARALASEVLRAMVHWTPVGRSPRRAVAPGLKAGDWRTRRN